MTPDDTVVAGGAGPAVNIGELQDFVENITAPLHWVGPDGSIVWANQAELDLLGYTRDEYIGHHIAEFHVGRERIDDILARLTRNETLCEYSSQLRHKDGSIRDVLINSNVFRRNGEFVHTRCLTIDVTARRRAERRLSLQYAVTSILSEADALKTATPRLFAEVATVCDCAVAAIWTVDEAANVLRCAETWQGTAARAGAFTKATAAMTFKTGIGLPGTVWASGSPLWLDDLARETNFPRLRTAVDAGLRSGFAFPIKTGDRITGVFECFTTELRPVEPDTLRLFEAIGAQLGHFIQRQQTDDARARLAAIVDSSDDAIVSKTLDGVITSWNRAAERMFGYSADEAVGRHITLIIPAERLAEEDQVLARLRRGEKIDHFETERVAKDGRRIDVSLTVSPVRTANGTIVGASKIARDITAQRRMARELADANRVKDEFLATLSHELRTPLNAVLGYTRMLRTGHLADEGRDRAIDIIERNANAVGQLVGDLLDVSSIVTGKVTLKPTACDLTAIVSESVDMIRPTAQVKGITIGLQMPPAPVTAQCDSARMQQVFWNLLTNAVKFTPAGGAIDVRVDVEATAARITVRDTGVGIRPDLLPYVFQRFWRGDSDAAHETRGLGLGLSIARHFIELHGGTIEARSDGEGRGSTFMVTVPRDGAGQP